MNGIIGTKIGMTSIYAADGKFIACTVVEVSPNIITQVKTEDADGYDALQFSYGEAKAKNSNQAITGHFRNTTGMNCISFSKYISNIYFFSKTFIETTISKLY